jgi:ferredoxin, 2Fe-2S
MMADSAKVEFIEQGIVAEVPLGSSILDAAQGSDAPEGYACGGVCACSTCHVYVEEGASLLSQAEEGEEDILDKAFDVKLSSRLGCQAKILRPGLIRVRISRESLEAYKNEHPETR